MNLKSGVTRNPIQCRVISISKDSKTIKVEIPRVVPHATYQKRMHLHSRVFADKGNVENIAVGMYVDILPTRRLSKLKSWIVVSLSQANQSHQKI